MFSAKAIGVLTPAALLFGLAWMAPRPVFAQEEATRVAVVDVESVVARSVLGQALQARLTEFTEATNVDGQAHLDALNAMRDSLLTGIDSLPQEELDRLQEAFASRSAEFDTFQNSKRQEAEQIRTTGFQQIEVALQPVLIVIRDELGYDLILNRAPGVVLITKPHIDITEVVLLRFNQATAPSP